MPWEAIGTFFLIIALRTIDVSLDALRISFSVQGRRKLSALVGFGEATTFAVAAGLVFTGLADHPSRVVAYGLGFALGQYLGVSAVQWLSLGAVTVRFFMPEGPTGLVEGLREQGFAVTVFDGQGLQGPVRLALVVVRRRELGRLMAAAKPWLSRCFVTVGDEPTSSVFSHLWGSRR